MRITNITDLPQTPYPNSLQILKPKFFAFCFMCSLWNLNLFGSSLQVPIHSCLFLRGFDYLVKSKIWPKERVKNKTKKLTKIETFIKNKNSFMLFLQQNFTFQAKSYGIKIGLYLFTPMFLHDNFFTPIFYFFTPFFPTKIVFKF